jgi:hypothetical protein
MTESAACYTDADYRELYERETAELERMMTALWLAIPEGRAYETRCSVNFEKTGDLPRHQLSSTLQIARRQMERYGIAYDAITDGQVVAYQAWRREKLGRVASSSYIIRISGKFAETRDGRPVGNLHVYTRAILLDGLGDQIDSRRIECVEEWLPEARNHGGGIGAVAHRPNLEKISAAIAAWRNRYPNAVVQYGQTWRDSDGTIVEADV